MNQRILELTVDITKVAMEKSTGGFIQNPDSLLEFMDKTAAKLEQIFNGPKTKS